MKERLIESIEKKRALALRLSHQIHQHPEIGNEEFKACGWLSEALEAHGFTVERGVAGHETAFCARKGKKNSGPRLVFLAEYDALPGLGHACGHNIIGTSSVMAAIAIGEAIDDLGGEVLVFGTPAEEGGPNGSAKGSFVREGFLEGIDAALMVHPYGDHYVTTPTLAVDPLDFEFLGKPAHAAASPHLGINALDAVIQLFNGINALREQLTDDVRIHGIITDGGEAPNIIPAYAKARFYIRAKTRAQLDQVTEKVKRVAEGAALQTGATLRVIAFQNPVDDLLITPSFDAVYQANLEALGAKFAKGGRGIGSTDAGNISQVVPTIHPMVKIGPSTISPHTEAFKEAAASEAGDEALLLAAKGLALTAYDLYTKKGLLEAIKEDHRKAKQAAALV